MTLFWMIIAGLTVLAMAFVGLPLLRKEVTDKITSDELNLAVFKQQLEELDSDLEAGNLDQNRYDAARKDLEKSLLTDVSTSTTDSSTRESHSGRIMAGTALLIPLAAWLIYDFLGSPEIINHLAQQPAAGTPQQTAHAPSGSMENLPPMDELVRRLAEKMQENPDNQDGWVMLGRSYMALNDHSAAINAYQRAMEMNDQRVDLLLAYAEAIAATTGNDFTGRAAPMIEKAYQLEPENPNVLWLAGILAYQSTDYQSAILRWDTLRTSLTPQSAELESVNGAIDDARKQLGMEPEEAELPSIVKKQQPKAQQQPAAAAANEAIKVAVSLSPELQAKTNPNDLVFIYAKAVSGPPMPLAAVRKKVSDLPISISLDDSMAMMPQMKLSGFNEVVVGARISMSGSPTAQAGDLEGEIQPVAPGSAETVQVVINSVHP
ncbi:MAG: c-type cytochrome biogenesis protein CcmI [Candidatus Thiodiazotropha taylori]|nr:c-type cytochrome biogenesis protein CcmI [Candidatus Thiodiazotropha taylori]MCG8085392.1 c-type cytochrome biogenesis protein CcmI [Candidatus Thiodiazotropha taylori]